MQRKKQKTTRPSSNYAATVMSAVLSWSAMRGPPHSSTAISVAIEAVREADRADREGVVALYAFLSVVLPLVPSEFLPKAKANDAAFVIVSFIRDPAGGLSTGTLRSMVKSLGLVALRVDLEDWPSIELAFETLLLSAVDKRSRVRRCAQSCLEVLLKNCHNSIVIKKASKVVHRMHRKYITLVKNPYSIESTDATLKNTVPKPEDLEALHMLNVLNAMLPYLSDKLRTKILSDAYKLLGCHFSWPTRHILRILMALLDYSDVKVLVAEAENIVSALTSYVSTGEKNPVDTIVSAYSLLKNVLRKFGDAFPSLWITYLPLVFTSLLGYLRSDSDSSKHVADILEEYVADILEESINFHVN